MRGGGGEEGKGRVEEGESVLCVLVFVVCWKKRAVQWDVRGWSMAGRRPRGIGQSRVGLHFAADVLDARGGL